MVGEGNVFSLEEAMRKKVKEEKKIEKTKPEDLNLDDLSKKELEKILYTGGDLMESPDEKRDDK